MRKKNNARLIQIGVNTKILGDFAQLFISCPEECGSTDKDRGNQVRVNKADALAIQASSFNRHPYFMNLCNSRLW